MRFALRLSKKWILTGLCLASAAMIVLPGYARRFRHAVRPALVPLSSAGTHVNVHLRTRYNEITGRDTAGEGEKITALKRQIHLMQQMVVHQQGQIQALTKWSGTLKGFRCKLLPARVVAVESLPLRNRRLLGAGKRDGVEAGDVVTTRRLFHETPIALPEKLTALGRTYVVGQISDCAAHSATLLLATDRKFRMNAQIWRMVEPGGKRIVEVKSPGGGRRPITFRHRGKSPGAHPAGPPVPVTATGDGRRIVLKDVAADHGIRSGDVLTSDNSAGLLPLGLSIGRVVRVERNVKAAHFVTVFVEPFADTAGLQEVYIVLPYHEAGPGKSGG